jgi:hypothetical protein
MNYAPLAGVHLTENEGSPTLAHSSGSEIGHGAKLSLTGRSKAFNVANDSLSLRGGSSECLVEQMLKRLQQFTAFGLQ